jgi:hypothetical protein
MAKRCLLGGAGLYCLKFVRKFGFLIFDHCTSTKSQSTEYSLYKEVVQLGTGISTPVLAYVNSGAWDGNVKYIEVQVVNKSFSSMSQ